jgi:hypothetical protein
LIIFTHPVDRSASCNQNIRLKRALKLNGRLFPILQKSDTTSAGWFATCVKYIHHVRKKMEFEYLHYYHNQEIYHMKTYLTLLLLLLAIEGFCQQKRNTKPTSKTPDFMVIGYLPGRSVDTTAIPFHRLSHINFSFAIPAKNGGGLDALRNWDKLIGLVKKAHKNKVQVFYLHRWLEYRRYSG